jgi:hypothetical protein
LANTWLLFFLREKQDLRSEEKLAGFYQLLAAHGCALATSDEIGTAMLWQYYTQNQPLLTRAQMEDAHTYPGFDPPSEEEEALSPAAEAAAMASLLQPGISPQVLQALKVFVTEQQKELTIEARLIAKSPYLRGFDLRVTLDPQAGTFILMVNDERYFSPRGLPGLMKFRYWLKLLGKVYDYWRPLFVHAYSHTSALHANPSWEDIQHLAVPHLFSFNIYGPELVAKYGAQRLAEAPAWLLEDMSDGGVMLIPTDAYTLSHEPSPSFAEVATYLGFPAEDAL